MRFCPNGVEVDLACGLAVDEHSDLIRPNDHEHPFHTDLHIRPLMLFSSERELLVEAKLCLGDSRVNADHEGHSEE